MSKKIILAFVIFSLISLIITTPALAGLSESLNKTAGQANLNTDQNLYVIVASIVQAIIGLLGLIFVVLLIYAGATWMTAMGEPKKLEKAKNIIKASLIGLIIIILSYSLAYYITSSLESATNPSSEAPAPTSQTTP